MANNLSQDNALTDAQLRATPVPISDADGTKDLTLQSTNDRLGTADTPTSGTGITGWLQTLFEGLGGILKSNLYREGLEVSAANPIPITGTVVSTGAELRVEVPLKATAHDLLNGAYAATSAIGDDYLLSTIRLRFSTTASKTITIYDSSGSYYNQLIDSTDRTVTLDGRKKGFDAGNQITIEVTQTTTPCSMELDMTIERGAVPLTGNPVLDPTSYGLQDAGNSTNSPLAAGATFVGVPSTTGFSGGLVQCFSDTNCEIKVFYSVNGGVDYDDYDPIRVYKNEARTFPLVAGPRTTLVVVTNDSGVDQTVLRLGTYHGQYPSNIPTFIGGITPRWSPAEVVKTFDSETAIAFGEVGGQHIVHQFGVNTVIDKVTTPEDIWFAGGLYTGFPTGAPEKVEFFSTSASDTGVLTYLYLESSASTSYKEGQVTLAGTTKVQSTHNVYRLNEASYNSGNSLTANAGIIEIRHITTTTNVFAKMRAGFGHPSICGYTVPALNTCLIKGLQIQVSKVKTAVCSGALWVRPLGKGPTMIEDFTASNQLDHTSQPYGGIRLRAGDDLIVRILSTSVDEVSIDAHLDLLIRDES